MFAIYSLNTSKTYYFKLKFYMALEKCPPEYSCLVKSMIFFLKMKSLIYPDNAVSALKIFMI